MRAFFHLVYVNLWVLGLFGLNVALHKDLIGSFSAALLIAAWAAVGLISMDTIERHWETKPQ